MDVQQFTDFMTIFTDAINAMKPVPAPANHTPKISIHLLTFRGEPQENATSWLLQVRNIFCAQGINDSPTRIYYAGTGLQGAALHWYLQKSTISDAFTDWNDFTNQLRGAFEPPHY